MIRLKNSKEGYVEVHKVAKGLKLKQLVDVHSPHNQGHMLDHW